MGTSNLQLDGNSISLAEITGTENEKVVQALNTLLILHADYGQNCSTSTMRAVGSSQADL